MSNAAEASLEQDSIRFLWPQAHAEQTNKGEVGKNRAINKKESKENSQNESHSLLLLHPEEVRAFSPLLSKGRAHHFCMTNSMLGVQGIQGRKPATTPQNKILAD